MSRQLRVERDHVRSCDLREQRDLRDLRDEPETYGSGRHHRDEYLDYDHHPTAASTSALTNNPERSNGRATLHDGRDDLQLVNLCVPTRSAIVVSKFTWPATKASVTKIQANSGRETAS
ncbi:unnamed protein product [Xylocopa violacea]|uniref:Uncharacterized protein n=1 Tax=Xylocopa violacea TaxID=135666 RepID=A0ABP1PB25_XYLVO